MTKDELRESLLSSQALSGLATAIADSASECIAVKSLPVGSESKIPVGASKIGGKPDLPSKFEWPTARDFPLIFLAQIALSDVPQLEETPPLPQSGLLSFFFDAEEQPWGFDPKDSGSWKVVYTPNVDDLSRREFPDDFFPESEFKACRLSLSRSLSLPSWERAAAHALDLNEEEMNAYEEVALQLRSSGHQLLGLPSVVQGDHMELQCQLTSHGLYCGDSTGYDDPRAKALSPGAAEWRLLMQFESDDDVGMMWGDGGCLYFWIREQDLALQNFDNVWVVLQCY